MMYAGTEYTVQIQTQQDLYNLKLNIQKTKIIAKRWGQGIKKQGQALFSWVPKSLQMVTTIMKLKDNCSLK